VQQWPLQTCLHAQGKDTESGVASWVSPKHDMHATNVAPSLQLQLVVMKDRPLLAAVQAGKASRKGIGDLQRSRRPGQDRHVRFASRQIARAESALACVSAAYKRQVRPVGGVAGGFRNSGAGIQMPSELRSKSQDKRSP